MIMTVIEESKNTVGGENIYLANEYNYVLVSVCMSCQSFHMKNVTSMLKLPRCGRSP